MISACKNRSRRMVRILERSWDIFVQCTYLDTCSQLDPSDPLLNILFIVISKGKGVHRGAFDNSLNKTVNYSQPGSQSYLWQKLVKLLPIHKYDSSRPCVFLHCHTCLWLVAHNSQTSQLFKLFPYTVFPFALKNSVFSTYSNRQQGNIYSLSYPSHLH